MKYDTENFQKDVIERSYSIPVLVDFWAEWCGPCKVLGPILEKIVKKNKDRFSLVKLNTEDFPNVAAEYGISSIPNVKLFINGEIADEFIGALPEANIENWLQKVLPSKHQKKLKKAKDLFTQGDSQKALKILEDIIAEEPENEEAAVLWAQNKVFSDTDRAILLVKGVQVNSNFYQSAEAILTLGRLLKNLSRIDGFPEGQVKEKYLKATRNLHEKKYEEALQDFIEVMELDRSYDDDGARKACIAIFKYLREENPVTRKYRPKFSRVLYS
jgi:putative thioredoxin